MICLNLIIGIMLAANVGGQTPVCATYEQPSKYLPPKQRTPAAPIKFEQEGHLLVFSSDYVGVDFALYDGETLLYSVTIGVDGCVLIPDDINGEVDLLLVKDGRYYHAKVEL